jgi:hypothetical protein
MDSHFNQILYANIKWTVIAVEILASHGQSTRIDSHRCLAFFTWTVNAKWTVIAVCLFAFTETVNTKWTVIADGSLGLT